MNRTNIHAGRRAFTLVELLLILALMTAMVAMAAPMLSGFFRGRSLDSEARRLLALTHAAQSRAAAEGFPMLLWLDAERKTYGLEQEAPPREGDPRAQEFEMEDNLALELGKATPVAVHGRQLPAIRFLPDGTIDETSPATVRLAGTDQSALWLMATTNRTNYEIRNRQL